MAESRTYGDPASNVGKVSPDGAWVWDGAGWHPTNPRNVADASGSAWPAQLPADQVGVTYDSGKAMMRRLMLSFQVFMGTAAVVMLGYSLQLVAPADFIGRPTARDSGVRLAWDFLGGIGFLAESLAFVVTAVLFLMWFHRMYRNLPALGVVRPHSTWRPIWVWFIPIANIFLVPRTVQEAWDGSHGRSVQHPKGAWATTKLDPPVRLWWLVFFVANVINRVAPGSKTDTVGHVVSGSLWLLAFEASLVGSAVLAIRMVRQMQAAQDARAVSRGWVPSSEPAPPRRCRICHQVVGADDISCRSCLSPL